MSVIHLENWFFAERISDSELKVVLPEHDDLYVIGENESDFGLVRASSRIVEKGDGYAITRSGNRYELGEMHADYKEMIEASKNGAKIITKWNVAQGRILNEVPDVSSLSFEDMIDIMTGKKDCHNGFMLWGESGDENVSGEVIAQSGNRITLRQSKLNSEGVFDEEYLVIWRNYGPSMVPNIYFGMDADERAISTWEDNFLFRCRPKLFA